MIFKYKKKTINKEDMRETKRVLGRMKVVLKHAVVFHNRDESKGSCWAIQGATRCSRGREVSGNLDAD